MSDSKQVDVLAVLDDYATGIEQAHKLARRLSERDEIAKGLGEFREACAAVAELIARGEYLCRTGEGMIAFRAALAACAPAKGSTP